MAGVQAQAPMTAKPLCSKFQSLSRDGGGSSTRVNIDPNITPEFQSLSRDGGGSSAERFYKLIREFEFQSLSRDGGGSSMVRLRITPRVLTSFNPSVGMAGVQANRFAGGIRNRAVSIPQSGWRGFKPLRSRSPRMCCPCFNPSVGMAGVQAQALDRLTAYRKCFNPSVGMAGVQASWGQSWIGEHYGFNPSVGMAGVQADHGRDGPDRGHRFNPSVGMAGVQAMTVARELLDLLVSIPQSGWRGFKPGCSHTPCAGSGFNPSVGMAGVQALAPGPNEIEIDMFQSLSRDGGGSSQHQVLDHALLDAVSIPQSGWRGFKPRLVISSTSAAPFQSLSRDGGGSS